MEISDISICKKVSFQKFSGTLLKHIDLLFFNGNGFFPLPKHPVPKHTVKLVKEQVATLRGGPQTPASAGLEGPITPCHGGQKTPVT